MLAVRVGWNKTKLSIHLVYQIRHIHVARRKHEHGIRIVAQRQQNVFKRNLDMAAGTRMVSCPRQ